MHTNTKLQCFVDQTKMQQANANIELKCNPKLKSKTLN